MKLLLIITLLVGLALSNEDGQYNPTESNEYDGVDDGQYIPDDSGQYIPDNSGQYRHDGRGEYKDDGSGKYTGEKQFYRNFVDNNNYKYSRKSDFPAAKAKIYKLQTLKSNNFPYKSAPSFSPNLILVNAKDLERDDKDNTDFSQSASKQYSNYQRDNNYEAAASRTSQNQHFINERAFPSRYPGPDGKYRIIKQSGDISQDGYRWDFETENGISAEEAGAVVNKGTNAEGMKAKGFYKYTGPDNVLYQVTYTADENGFVAQGKHLPTPPAIPPAILKSLEFQKGSRKL